MNELFPVTDDPSPRLRWLRAHQVQTRHFPEVTPGDEDEFGNEQYPWLAAVGELDGATGFHLATSNRVGVGQTEHEAIVDLALKRGWKLWNEYED